MPIPMKISGRGMELSRAVRLSIPRAHAPTACLLVTTRVALHRRLGLGLRLGPRLGLGLRLPRVLFVGMLAPSQYCWSVATIGEYMWYSLVFIGPRSLASDIWAAGTYVLHF